MRRRMAMTTRMLGVVAIVVTFASALGALVLMRANTADLRDAARENILWSALQLELETQRFVAALGAYAAGQGSAEDVSTRFDILWSRATVFTHGSVGERLSSYDPGGQVIGGVLETLARAEPLVVGLGPDNRHMALEIAAMFAPLADALRALSREVLHGEEARASALRDELLGSARTVLWLSGAALVFSLVMLAVLWRETRLSARMAAENLRLAEHAQDASRAKSLFLTMMSHELRTPLNGFFGMLSLLRATPLSAEQRELLGSAERIGRRLTELLENITEFADLQEGRLAVQTVDLALPEIADALQTDLAAAAEPEGLPVRVEVASGPPLRLSVDRRLVCRIVRLAVAGLAEQPGAAAATVRLAARAGQLEIAVQVTGEGLDAGAVRRLVAAEAPSGRAEAGFATDDLRAAILRAMVNALGGRCAAVLQEPQRLGLAIWLAVPTTPARRPVVRIETESRTVSALCRLALPEERVALVEGDDATPPDFVLCDRATRDAQAVAELRARWPGATVLEINVAGLAGPSGLQHPRANVSWIRQMVLGTPDVAAETVVQGHEVA